MSIALTDEQRQALSREAESPPRVIDPTTNTAYVLLRADLYEKVRSLLEEDEVRALEPLLAELAPEDWEDAANYESRP